MERSIVEEFVVPRGDGWARHSSEIHFPAVIIHRRNRRKGLKFGKETIFVVVEICGLELRTHLRGCHYAAATHLWYKWHIMI
jgi:hypothetical protein